MAHASLTFLEQRGGEVKKSSLEALGAGVSLAGALGGTGAAVIAGSGIGDAAAALGKRGADRVYAADGEGFALYSTEGYAAVTAAAVDQASPAVLVFAASAMGKDLAPRVAARLGWTFVPDAVAASIENGKLVVKRPQYAGKAIWTLALEPKNVVLTVRPNTFAVPAESGEAAPVESLSVDVVPRARVVALSGKEKGVVDVAEAEVIVSGGRGLKGPENFPLVFDLAKELEAGVGASRAVVDAGWIDHDHQVGQTGKTVSPTLYIACGISGAIQHLAGMRTSKCIVAINKDPEAPIFQIADYGLVGDVFEILPKLTEAVRGVKA
jgi:electron transfer flavoprotein alpha subunit